MKWIFLAFVSLSAFAELVPSIVPAPANSMAETAAILNQTNQANETRDLHPTQNDEDEKRKLRMQKMEESEEQRRGSLGNENGQGYMPQGQ